MSNKDEKLIKSPFYQQPTKLDNVKTEPNGTEVEMMKDLEEVFHKYKIENFIVLAKMNGGMMGTAGLDKETTNKDTFVQNMHNAFKAVMDNVWKIT